MSSISDTDPLPYGISAEGLRKDLTTERPQWIFSAFAPGKNPPIQLFGGPEREQSFEEMRVRHYLAVASGNPQQAVQEAQQLYDKCEQQIRVALNNIPGAVEYVVKGQDTHPNRYDICSASMAQGQSTAMTSTTAFGRTAAGVSTSPFGQTAAFGQTNSVAPQQSSFGQPSGSAFGQHGFGQSNNPSFGQTGFGKPAAPAFGQTGFGKPAAPAFGQTGFGQPSAFGQTAGTGFGKPSSLGSGGGFSAFSQKGPAFGQTGFGSASGGTTAPSTFGQPSNVGVPQAQTTSSFGSTGFGQPVKPQVSPFDQPTQSSTTPATNSIPGTTTTNGLFGSGPTSSPFGQPAQTSISSPFGQPNQAPASASPFGRPVQPLQQQQQLQQAATTTTTTTPFGKPTQTSTQTFSPPPKQADVRTFDMSNRLIRFKGYPVRYTDQGDHPYYINSKGEEIGIWHPKIEDLDPDCEADNNKYDEKTSRAYMWMLEHREWKLGEPIPLVPPRKEWIAQGGWDF